MDDMDVVTIGAIRLSRDVSRVVISMDTGDPYMALVVIEQIAETLRAGKPVVILDKQEGG